MGIPGATPAEGAPMNAPDLTPPLFESLALTREPFPASVKTYLGGALKVPVREVALTNGETVTLYDTSGPYTDPGVAIDVRSGLPPLRARWIDLRADTEPYTGRAPRALDDGAKDEAAERLSQLREDAAALQRTPRRAKAGLNVTQM